MLPYMVAPQDSRAGRQQVIGGGLKYLYKLFNEIQDNYISMYNPATGKSGLVIAPIAFMNRLIMFFPFLESEKKY